LLITDFDRFFNIAILEIAVKICFEKF